MINHNLSAIKPGSQVTFTTEPYYTISPVERALSGKTLTVVSVEQHECSPNCFNSSKKCSVGSNCFITVTIPKDVIENAPMSQYYKDFVIKRGMLIEYSGVFFNKVE